MNSGSRRNCSSVAVFGGTIVSPWNRSASRGSGCCTSCGDLYRTIRQNGSSDLQVFRKPIARRVRYSELWTRFPSSVRKYSPCPPQASQASNTSLGGGPPIPHLPKHAVRYPAFFNRAGKLFARTLGGSGVL